MFAKDDNKVRKVGQEISAEQLRNVCGGINNDVAPHCPFYVAAPESVDEPSSPDPTTTGPRFVKL